MVMIDWDKIDRTKIKTRGGKAVRIYATDGGGDSPHVVHGAVMRLHPESDEPEGWEMETWELSGRYFGHRDSSLDLDFSAALMEAK
jgi:hypothetical protein